MSLDELRERLHTLPDQPDLVPVPDVVLPPHLGLLPLPSPAAGAGAGRRTTSVIDSTLEPGHLTYGELRLRGLERRRGADLDLRLPSVAGQRQPLRDRGRDDARQAAAAAAAAAHLSLPVRAGDDRAAVVAAPEPRRRWIASSTAWRVSCIGDEGGLTYKRSRRGDAEVDRAVELVLRDSGAAHRVLDWEPWGGDERQFCSPGFNLPVGCLMRTPHGGFAGLPHVRRRARADLARTRSARRSAPASTSSTSSRPIGPA